MVPLPQKKAPQRQWRVYIVLCADNTLYTGITNDLPRRLAEHNDGPRGAKYTRSRRPARLVYCEEAADRAAAAKREYQIKHLALADKTALITAAGASMNEYVIHAGEI
ncbi:MAG: GIY-YIG nuclease family protein [Desulfobulbaceae bacterium]|nr:GIY-YIG nuclease family protein [Desulfobulbaceae bacterium]